MASLFSVMMNMKESYEDPCINTKKILSEVNAKTTNQVLTYFPYNSKEVAITGLQQETLFDRQLYVSDVQGIPLETNEDPKKMKKQEEIDDSSV